jgi:hypothetical protein
MMIYRILFQKIDRKLLSGLFLILLSIPTVAVANSLSQTEKPSVELSEAKQSKKRRKPPSDYSRAGGSRGCPGESVPLTVLAPNTFVGKTTSLRPTFTWFVSKPKETQFRLFELTEGKSPKRVGTPIKLQSKSGINKLSLPKERSPLTVGKTYIWQVSIDCPDSPFMQRAEFSVVQKPSVLNNKLSKANNSSEKAYIYAEQDLWYEAMEEAFKTAPQGKLGQLGSQIVKNLAESDSYIPEQTTADKLKVLQQEIQQRKSYLEKIAEK